LQAPSSSSCKSLLPKKKERGTLGYLPKISLLREKSFDFNSFGGEDVEGKKMLLQIFF
jgi:hypothetical protein